jgi:ketosteroid isomerase-like protein
MDREAIKALIDQAYEYRRPKHIEGIMSLFHPDARFELAGSKALTAVAGVSQGHQELRTTLARLIANFEFEQREIVNIVIENEQAVVHSRVRLRFIPKNFAVTTDLVDIWKFDNAKIVELVEFVDTALINDLVR